MQTPLGPVVSIPQQVDSTDIMPGPMTPAGLNLEQVGSTDLTVGYIASAADSTPAPAAPATTLVDDEHERLASSRHYTPCAS